jgi:hypothetical protein
VSGRRAAVLAAEMACLAYAQLGALGVVRAALPSYPEMVAELWPAAAQAVVFRKAAEGAPKRKRGRLLRAADELLVLAAAQAVSEVVVALVSTGGAPGRLEVPVWAPFRADEWPQDQAGVALSG